MTEAADITGIPLHEETLSVARQTVKTGAVRVETVTHLHDALIDETLTHQTVEVMRVPIGRAIDSVPLIREEGDTTIIPVVEEVVFIEKRLVLKEEVHLRRVQVTEQHTETVPLRQQEAVITRC